MNVKIMLTRLKTQKVAKRFIKLGNTSLTPAMAWDDYSKNPRRVYPPTKMNSRREIIKETCNYMMSTIKSRKLFVDAVEACIQHNNLSRNIASQIIQKKEVENSNL